MFGDEVARIVEVSEHPAARTAWPNPWRFS